ncbi:DUF6902 family protein [Primorskyibacter sp. S187A]|uniref:DUF6902 family protein n=1 Tax=Primorskyibacter sp. S187A TaxID=3415130 RepID=UPI003C7E8DA3
MSNVIHVSFPTREERRADALGTLIRDFAISRRLDTDVFWLKENGELLNILECTGAQVAPAILGVHEATYSALPERLAFFPQYYRFLVSLALDLEDLGLSAGPTGNVAQRMCDWVVDQGLAEGETSDIQRLEAQRLLSRRNCQARLDTAAVQARLRQFISAPQRFALPNKKAAYELTHIVFYLTEYGRIAPDFDAALQESLENVGVWAFLDGNADLLAEVCIAMRYAGYNPYDTWESWIAQRMKSVTLTRAPAVPAGDAYHSVFMGAWLSALRGGDGLAALDVQPGEGAPVLMMPKPDHSALREMSRHLYGMPDRSSDWARMRGVLDDRLSDQARGQLASALETGDAFERFFEGFARASRVVQA